MGGSSNVFNQAAKFNTDVYGGGYLKDALGGGGPSQTGMTDTTKEGNYASMIQGLYGQIPTDQKQIMDTAEKEKALGTGYNTDYAKSRAQNLSDLSTLLAQQQNRQLGLEVPALAENANLKGIFRSTGLGNSIADRAETLAEQTSSELSKQGIANSQAGIADTQGTNNAYLGAMNTSLGRGLSLEDLANQANIAKTTGQALQPQAYTPGKTAGQTAIPVAALQAGATIAAK